MTFLDESSWRPSQNLSAAQVAHYRDVLITHANNPGNRKCRICLLTGCPKWRNAYDRLAMAGELMADPEQWRDNRS